MLNPLKVALEKLQTALSQMRCGKDAVYIEHCSAGPNAQMQHRDKARGRTRLKG